ncbi:phosphotransferase enzyme family protein [Hydrotalea sandarakina]|jgi:thiamine kinase-like enzyme|uniref:Phosphotransferase family enzyme n=1 Tax=Hydrotalea sandarakina TaxID=1004304 RepID=A0A2W7SNY1_9BACT|nr:phosphotransferase [Hydrotalea sandarakina]PZX64665.1 phosphotransferase family enzyme [Hydrotalea sandarakina]
MNTINQILTELQVEKEVGKIEIFGNGLVNNTWLVTLNNRKIIVQRINTNVFKHPENIDHNINVLANYFKKNYPEYIFTKPLSNKYGISLFNFKNEFYRAYEYINNSYYYNILEKEDLAYEAAKQFGKFTKQCEGLNIKELKTTIKNFHNLSLRYKLFENAISKADSEKKNIANDIIRELKEKSYIKDKYNLIIKFNKTRLRVTHHDTKINNVLFDKHDKGICIIDLDTIMPGYFISDVGDMMRTYLSPADENEIDLENIYIRNNYFFALTEGYLEEMNTVLKEEELNEFIYSGQFMIYMQAIRFLTDYLENDIYYGAKFPLENYYRAKNQLTLLERYEEKIADFKTYIKKLLVKKYI